MHLLTASPRVDDLGLRNNLAPLRAGLLASQTWRDELRAVSKEPQIQKEQCCLEELGEMRHLAAHSGMR